MTVLHTNKLEKAVDKTVLEALAPHGFVKDKTGGAFCDRGEVFWYMAGLTQHLGGRNQIRPFGQIGFAETNQIYFAFLEPGEPLRKATGELQVNYRHFAGERDAYISCEEEEELPRALQQVRELVLNKMLPCLEKHSDPREVLRVYIAHDERSKNSLGLIGAHHYSSALSGLILARLYGPEHYKSLRKRYAFFFEPLLPEIKRKALNLLAYLDCDPLPGIPAQQCVQADRAEKPGPSA